MKERGVGVRVEPAKLRGNGSVLAVFAMLHMDVQRGVVVTVEEEAETFDDENRWHGHLVVGAASRHTAPWILCKSTGFPIMSARHARCLWFYETIV